MNPLMEASRAGNIDLLYAVIRGNPNVLVQFDGIPFADTPLHVSASKGHIPYSMEIMELMPSLATKLNPDGFSPIHLALQNGHDQLVIRLVDKNSNLVRVKGRGGITPLHYAAEKGNLQLLTKFLSVSPKSVEDVNVRNETALHIALRYEMFEPFDFIVAWLCLNYHEEACYLEKKILNWIDAEGNTILHIATIKKQLRFVTLLLRCKVDVNAKNVEGWTALDYVQDENTNEIKDLLCSAGALGASSITIIDKYAPLLRKDQRLKMAAQLGDIDALYSTIEDDPRILDRIDKISFLNTPLHIAASKGHTEFALEIRRLKPSFGRKLNQDGLSPLHLAFCKEHYETANRLIAEDEQLVRVKGKMGKTPLHIAAEQGNMAFLIISLAACPSSIEDVTDHQETALHIACKNNRMEALRAIFRCLQYAGFRMVINWPDSEGNTVLHIASLKNQIWVVRFLTRGLPSALRSVCGSLIRTLFNCSNPFSNIGYEVTLKLFLSLKNFQGLTAMDILQQQGRMPITEINAMRSFAAKDDKFIDLCIAEYLKRRNMPTTDERAIDSGRTNSQISDENRSGAITVAVLIAAATFQAVLSPPRGLWQGEPTSFFSNGTSISNASAIVQNNTPNKMVGTSVMSCMEWFSFSILNTAAFWASIVKINHLLCGGKSNIAMLLFPLGFCYTAAIVSIAPRDQDDIVAPISSFIIMFASALLFLNEFVKESRIRRCKMIFKIFISNFTKPARLM